MRRSGNKILIIVLVAIAVLAILGGVFAYMFFCTDIFRTSQELFAKYLTQNIDELGQTVNLKKVDEIENKLSQNKYEESITISYTEAEETEPAAEITIDTQNDPINKINYGIVGLSMDELEESLKIEYMKENDAYSLRFTNAVKQFLTIENANLKQLAANLGMDEEVVEEIPDTIDFEQFSLEGLKITEEEKNAEINKYANLLYNNISKDKYSKTKNAVITLNGKTITTNAYIVTLNTEDIKNLSINLLETLKTDEIILGKLQIIDEKIQEYTEESPKESFVETIQQAIDELTEEETLENENIVITVYEQKGKTVRIKLEQDLEYITLDTAKVDGKKQIDMKYTSIDEENTQLSSEVIFIKENENKLTIQFNTIDGEEQSISKLSTELVENENNVKIDVLYQIENENILFSRNINFVEEINYKVTLDNSNNIVLNDLPSEQMSAIFNAVGGRLTTEYLEPIEPVIAPIAMAIIIYGNYGDLNESIFTEEEIQFNSKFEQYEGVQKTQEEVKLMLNTVQVHNLAEKEKENPQYVIVTGEVTLNDDATAIDEVQEGTYSIQCLYKDSYVSEIMVMQELEIQ